MTVVPPILEVAEFGTLAITFDERVLRPRPWTADQSAWAAELLRSAPAGPVLELCAGAGQIGLLAVADSDRQLVCVDLSPVACQYARLNADANGLGHRVEVREGPMDEVVRDSERFALVVADPPWVRRTDVQRYPEDPVLAIDGGDDGLDVARTCLDVARRHLRPGGSVVLQIGTQDQVELLREACGDLELVEVRQGERGVLVRLDLR
ncbi:methyltransferase [Nocardioides mangrovi]|uniref:Class I SAM-dependent methyltransferase n=1 Tax=Nocardioides mangrovi TaxID=2874580 RepID=A0ABS7UDT8_9ACTN|nr:class I SAM-dependent methyltransferase [Nocardioides mangrovi]MBZ5739163.1 class I SAM-dependent methyltransferase [Nocardioides mangrovi]